MFNNKGQSLVLFVIVIPILMFLLILVIDVGKIISLKQELNSINELVLDYGLDNLNDENIDKKLIDLINLNKSDIDKINIHVNNNEIFCELSDRSEGIFLSFINISGFNIKDSSKSLARLA